MGPWWSRSWPAGSSTVSTESRGRRDRVQHRHGLVPDDKLPTARCCARGARCRPRVADTRRIEKATATLGHRHVQEHAAAAGDGFEGACGGREPRHRIRQRVAAEHGLAGCFPGHKSSGHRRVVTERHPVACGLAASVAGDAHPDPPGARCDVVGSDTQLLQRPWARRLDDDVGVFQQGAQFGPSLAGGEVQPDLGLALGMEQAVEGRLAARPVGTRRALDLGHLGPGVGQDPRRQGARPHRRQVDDAHRLEPARPQRPPPRARQASRSSVDAGCGRGTWSEDRPGDAKQADACDELLGRAARGGAGQCRPWLLAGLAGAGHDGVHRGDVVWAGQVDRHPSVRRPQQPAGAAGRAPSAPADPEEGCPPGDDRPPPELQRRTHLGRPSTDGARQPFEAADHAPGWRDGRSVGLAGQGHEAARRGQAQLRRTVQARALLHGVRVGVVARRYAAAIAARSPVVIPAARAASLLAAAHAGSEEILGILEAAPILAVDLTTPDADLAALAPPAWLPCVVIGLSTRPTAAAPAGVDVAVAGAAGVDDVPSGWVAVDDPGAELDRLSGAVGTSAPAAVTLAQVLRLSDHLAVDAALSVESLAYSALQCGPGFACVARGPRPAPAGKGSPDQGPSVVAERDGGVLRLTLNRPHVRNAVSRGLRDELCEALAVACADQSVTAVELRGAGPAFCSGGDLDEFGTLRDPVDAHLARTSRSPARLLATVADRVTAHVHGACVGAGIELAAFAGRVVADPSTRFSLPELGLGLIPGAGGTVSIPRRIGRHRTAWLALRASPLDARTALRWGLVDEIATAPAPPSADV